MPMTMPRTTWFRPMNRQPFQMALATDGSETSLLRRRCPISLRVKIVSADTTNVAALKYSARLT